LLLIDEANDPQVEERICLPLIADTHSQQVNRPDSAVSIPRHLPFMRLSDEQEVRSLAA
jgi:hypothetical protein